MVLGCATFQYLNGDNMALSMRFGDRVLANTTISGNYYQHNHNHNQLKLFHLNTVHFIISINYIFPHVYKQADCYYYGIYCVNRDEYVDHLIRHCLF